ncbi:MAG: IMP dehydrogenase [Patescibacteria group bacterium]
MNRALDVFFTKMDRLGIALTYGDVRLKTNYSDIVPSETSLVTRFSQNVPLNVPIVSAAMDTVTEAKMAIALATHGGLGIIHKNLSPREQARQVNRVKLYLNGLIESPICVDANDTISHVLTMREKQGYTFHSFPVIENGRLVGLLTRNDFDFAQNQTQPVHEVMTPQAELITAPAGTSINQAYEQMESKKKKLLPLLNDRGEVTGLYVLSDLKRIRSDQSIHNVDKDGHLRVAAAVGVGEGALERAELLAAKGCDVFVVGTAHGDSENVCDAVKELKHLYPHIDVVAGNVSRGEAAKRLADVGADGILVGQGPGSICTTRIVAGIGCPQVTAVYECAEALRGTGIPVCADGGIGNSGDIVVALGVGAQSVILGRLLAGTEEAPGTTRMINGTKVKEYRGMGSLGAMQDSVASREQYRQDATPAEKLVPEGVESVVPFMGSVRDVLDQYLGGVRSGMGYVGARTVAELAARAELIRITSSGLAESHPHDVVIVKDAPNYRR